MRLLRCVVDVALYDECALMPRDIDQELLTIDDGEILRVAVERVVDVPVPDPVILNESGKDDELQRTDEQSIRTWIAVARALSHEFR